MTFPMFPLLFCYINYLNLLVSLVPFVNYCDSSLSKSMFFFAKNAIGIFRDAFLSKCMGFPMFLLIVVLYIPVKIYALFNVSTR